MILRSIQIHELEARFSQLYYQKSKDLISVLDLGGDRKSPFCKVYSNSQSFIVNLYDSADPDIVADLTSEASLEKFKSMKTYFDICLCLNVIEHLKDPFPLVRCIKSMLRQGVIGEAVLFVPFLHRYHPNPSDYARYTQDSFSEWFNDDFLRVTVNQHGGSWLLLITSILFQVANKRLWILDKLLTFFVRIIITLGLHRVAGNYPLGYSVSITSIESQP